MTHSPDRLPGVGEVQAEEPDRTEFLDFVASEGLREALLVASELRKVAGSRPGEFPNAAERAQLVQKIAAYMDLGLKQAGYTESDIQRLPESTVGEAPRDPHKPRTNL